MALLLVAVAIAGSAAPATPPRKWTVHIQGFRFVPETLEVSVGDTVVWKNDDIVPHTATAKKVFDSKNLDNGQSWSYTAKHKGEFAYICTYHPTMKAQLNVR